MKRLLLALTLWGSLIASAIAGTPAGGVDRATGIATCVSMLPTNGQGYITAAALRQCITLQWNSLLASLSNLSDLANVAAARTALGIANNDVTVAAPPAKGDAIILGGASTTAGSNVITDSSASFKNSDVHKLISITYQNTFTVTSPASPAVFSWVNHGLSSGDVITLFGLGLPTGLTAGTTYYVIATGLTANNFELAPNPGGTAINTSGSQSGSHFAISSAGYNGTIGAVLSPTSVSTTTNVPSTSSNAPMIYGTDNCGPFTSAAAAFPLIYAPPGNYMISCGVTFQLANGAGLTGDGVGATNIDIASTTVDGFAYQFGTTYPQMQGVHITRIGTAQPGANNVDVSQSTLHGYFNNLFLEHGYQNIVLGGTQFGTIANVTSQFAVSNGVYLTNASSGEPLQWQLDNVIAGANGGSGFFAECVAGTAGYLGEWRTVQTFANGGHGVQLLGKAGCPVGDNRFTNLFLGSDFLGEAVFDTFGGTALIQGSSWAEGGNAACVTQTASAGHISIQGMTFNTCGQQGAFFSGSSFEITGGNIVGCVGAGIFADAGSKGTVTNVRMAGNGAGIFLSDTAAGVLVAHNNLIDQATSPVHPGAGTANDIHDNLGYNPVGGSSLTPGASPWTHTNGPTPETLYLSASTSITGVNTSSVSLPAVGSNTPLTLELGPNESAVVAYTGSLTANHVVH